MPGKFSIGVDLGGTKVLAGVIAPENGKVLSVAKKKTGNAEDGDSLTRKIALLVEEALQAASLPRSAIKGLGVGVAGMVDRLNGTVIQGVNLGLKEFPLARKLTHAIGVPCKLGNDVEAATLGELRFGAGQNCSDFLCVFVGTGIGSGVVVNGKILSGASGTAGEIGHTIYQPNGRPCNCGLHGCLEMYASRLAIARQVATDIALGVNSTVKDKLEPGKGILRSKAIATAVQEGDHLVTRCVMEAASCLGVTLGSAITYINPKKIILGGGLIQACDFYFRHAVDAARRNGLPTAVKKVEIIKSGLGDYAGIIGASLL